MHIKTASNGSKKVVISRAEWLKIGSEAGWSSADAYRNWQESLSGPPPLENLHFARRAAIVLQEQLAPVVAYTATNPGSKSRPGEEGGVSWHYYAGRSYREVHNIIEDLTRVIDYLEKEED